MRYPTPLRYPGGKRRLAEFVALLMNENSLTGGHYVEPYAGGAGLALALLYEGHATHIHINDLSKGIYAFWASILEETDDFLRLLWDTPVNMETWEKQRALQQTPDSVPPLDLGFSTFFLNRTNRSGIISGGAIGGRQQAGKWKLDARFNKESLSLRIEKLASYRTQISVYNQDAGHFLYTIVQNLPEEALVYLDPPYYARSRRLYENHYDREDHERLQQSVRVLNQRWMVSYDSVPEVYEIYSPFRHKKYSLSYSAGTREKGSEVIFFSHALVVPSVEDPVRIKEGVLGSL